MANLVLDITPVAPIQQMFNDPFLNPLRVAIAAENAGVDGIALIFSPQNEGISREEVEMVRKNTATFLNMMVPFHPEAIRHAQSIAPDMVTLVNLAGKTNDPLPLPITEMAEDVQSVVTDLKANGISVALFIEPEFDNLKVVGKLDADAVILDCRAFTEAPDSNARLLAEENLQTTARGAFKLGLGVHLMGNIEREHLRQLKSLPFVEDMIVGKAVLKRAFFSGLDTVIQQMRSMMWSDRENI